MAGVDSPVPALLTSTSRPASSSASVSMTPAASGRPVRSSCRTTARLPHFSTSLAVSWAPASSVCQVMPTSKPSWASATALALPMPESEPVTMATRWRRGVVTSAVSLMVGRYPAGAVPTRSHRELPFTEVKARLTAHSVAEEEHVYPALARKDPAEADEVHHGVEEHREARGERDPAGVGGGGLDQPARRAGQDVRAATCGGAQGLRDRRDGDEAAAVRAGQAGRHLRPVDDDQGRARRSGARAGRIRDVSVRWPASSTTTRASYVGGAVTSATGRPVPARLATHGPAARRPQRRVRRPGSGPGRAGPALRGAAAIRGAPLQRRRACPPRPRTAGSGQ